MALSFGNPISTLQNTALSFGKPTFRAAGAPFPNRKPHIRSNRNALSGLFGAKLAQNRPFRTSKANSPLRDAE